MPHLEGVAIPDRFGGAEQRAPAHAPVVAAGQAFRRRGIGGQQAQESFDAIGPERSSPVTVVVAAGADVDLAAGLGDGRLRFT